MYKKNILTNGIRVISEYIPYVNSVSIGVWVLNGSRNESIENNGISHFIEHMLFKGTKNRTGKKIAEDIEEVGGQINAFTGKETTCFYIKILDSHLDLAIDVLSDMILNSKFNKEDIEKEKSVILEEINMYEDSPEDLVTDLLAIATWPCSSIGYPILGEYDTIKNFDRELLMQYINLHYNTSNIVISIAGNFDDNKLINILENKFSKLSKETCKTISDFPKMNKKIITKVKDIEQIHLCLGLNGIEIGNEDLYSLLIINNVFGGGTSSLLFQKIREDAGLAYSIYSYPSSYKNTGLFSIYAGLNPKYLHDAINLIKEEIYSIKENGITELILKKSKEQLKGNYILGLESTSNRMFGIGKSELLINNVYEPKEIMDKIDDIKIDDINRVINYVFKDGIISAAIVGKINEKEDIERLIF